MKVLLAVFALALVVLVSAKNYRNHKVVTFTIESDEQLKELQELEKDSGVKIIDFRQKNLIF